MMGVETVDVPATLGTVPIGCDVIEIVTLCLGYAEARPLGRELAGCAGLIAMVVRKEDALYGANPQSWQYLPDRAGATVNQERFITLLYDPDIDGSMIHPEAGRKLCELLFGFFGWGRTEAMSGISGHIHSNKGSFQEITSGRTGFSCHTTSSLSASFMSIAYRDNSSLTTGQHRKNDELFSDGLLILESLTPGSSRSGCCRSSGVLL